MKDIAWMQVAVAFFLGVLLAAVVRSLWATVRNQASSALG